jgi:hypothetical protein
VYECSEIHPKTCKNFVVKSLERLNCLQWRRLCVQAGFLQQLIRGTGHSARKYCLLQGKSVLFISYNPISFFTLMTVSVFLYLGPRNRDGILTFLLLYGIFSISIVFSLVPYDYGFYRLNSFRIRLNTFRTIVSKRTLSESFYKLHLSYC